MWKRPTKETLINLMMDQLTVDQMGDYFDCSSMTIRNCMKEFKLDYQVYRQNYSKPIKDAADEGVIKVCLGCAEPFKSSGDGNRICLPCKAPGNARNCLGREFEGVA
jgi:hypothetical protein